MAKKEEGRMPFYLKRSGFQSVMFCVLLADNYFFALLLLIVAMFLVKAASVPTEGMLKCEACECRHPSGHPKLCGELDHFLEEQFSSEYALRRSLIQQKKNQEQTKVQVHLMSKSFSLRVQHCSSFRGSSQHKSPDNW
ncbi:hypothetical protein HanPI659440_Chr03g0120471 [Helianthus annuus]|nr:hypothetical protein HanPI659440_Chr03g0120471 [Helianthus annuus]